MSSPVPNIILPQSLMKGLYCAAMNPGLRSILVFDASPDELTVIASALVQLLRAATDQEVELIRLGVSEVEDDLWGNLAIHGDEGGHSVGWRHGLLTAPVDDPTLRLIVIPDLTGLSLAAARACVMLVGADVAHRERHGQQELWKPQYCWLASCAEAEVGSLSPHLLDRFALRLHGQGIRSGRQVRDAEWLRLVLKDVPDVEPSDFSLPPHELEHIKKAVHSPATLNEDAIKSVYEHVGSLESSSLRREIALARLASGLAQLENEGQVKLKHVAEAARLIALPSIESPREVQSPDEDDQPPLPFPEPVEPPIFENDELSLTPTQLHNDDPVPPSLEQKQQQVLEDIYESDEPMEQEKVLAPVHPYPEDKAPIKREIASLQVPLKHSSGGSSNKGTVIGVERSETLYDLAIVSMRLTRFRRVAKVGRIYEAEDVWHENNEPLQRNSSWRRCA